MIKRSCRKCEEWTSNWYKEMIEFGASPPDPCMTCRRFYDDNFKEKEQ